MFHHYHSRLKVLLTSTFLCLVAATFAVAQEEPAPKVESKINSGFISALPLRSIGPALMSGRIADIAVDPTNPNVWYVGVGSGGVWKTTNSGTTFESIFDGQKSYSIGCITIDPNNNNTIWIGSGENVGGRHVGYGDGIYVSHNGGKTFTNMGLAKSEHLSKIIVHPKNSQIVFAASQGPLWSAGGQRGLYKSIDGGANWKNVLNCDGQPGGEFTGVTDVTMDPNDPNTLYAATHQRHRTVWSLLNTGPRSGIHKSTDGGESWVELKTGLPGGDKGKIALQVSPQKSNIVYAAVEQQNRVGGFYRSEDFGGSWSKMSDYVGGGTGPHYYQEIYCDPHRFDVIYHANVRMGRTEDGGKTWGSVSKSTKHVDNHAVAFSPTDPNFLIVGCDGGLYRSYDYAQSYSFCANLPLTQFYKVDVDYDFPFYNVVGGTQDNNTQYGPSRTGNVQGIRNADWRITIGGDGHDNAIDPTDPNIMYCESQEGNIRRFDRRTGQSVDIRPRPGAGEDNLRFNWDSPILISPHDNKRIYFASKFLHRSDDRGDSWTTVSPDLSRNQNRYKLKMMDRVWSVDAGYDLLAMSQYGNITSLSESPLVEGLLYVGTDDGLIHVSEDGGDNWTVTEKIFGVPEYFFVNDIKADRHDANVAYACLDNHKTGDYKPYLVKSTDRGKTWTLISGDLPERHLVWRIEQDHENKNLFFLGTEYGLFCSLDGCKTWIKMTSGAPNIPFRDLAIQRRENDLVAATFGRGFYVLDDYSPLRDLTDELIDSSDLHIFPMRKALWYLPQDLLGGKKGSQGDSYFETPNPAFGATLTYYLKSDLKTKAAIRKAAEAKQSSNGEDISIPTWDQLRAESLEQAPKVYFEFYNQSKEVVARVNGSTNKGLHRMSWNLRYTEYNGSPMVAPGNYSVQGFKLIDGNVSKLGNEQSFEVVSIEEPSLKPQNLADTIAYQLSLAKLNDSIGATSRSLATRIERITKIQAVIQKSPGADPELLKQARELELKLRAAARQLNGDNIKSDKFVEDIPSIGSRVSSVLYGSSRNTYGITQTQKDQVEIAKTEFKSVSKTIKKLINSNFESFEKKLNQAGIPWTEGRDIPRLK